MSARVALGRISGIFGVRGWVKVYSHTRPAEGIFEYRRWRLGGTANTDVELMEGRVQGRGLVARLANADGVPIEDRDQAARLVGAEIEIDRDEMPRLPRGHYYWVDLIGLDVVSVSGESLGKVQSMSDNGAQDVISASDGERQWLIPFVRGPVVKSVELKRRRIVVDWSRDY